MANCSSLEKLPAQPPKDANGKQILKEDPCFSLWSPSGPSKTMFIVIFSKKKSYPPPSIFAFYLCKEINPETSKAALEWSLALYCTFRQKGKMFKCYPVDWSSPSWPPNRQFLLKLDRRQQRLKSPINVKAESEQEVHEVQNFQDQPVLWPLPEQFPTSQKGQSAGADTGKAREFCSMSKSFYIKAH